MGIAGTGKTTIAKAINKQDKSFKLAYHHGWIDPVLRLLGDDSDVFWSLDEKGWDALNKARDVILNTMVDVCPKENNFVITFEMLANNPWHQNFFDKVHDASKKRGATLIPVRLVCELEELMKRLKSDSRKNYYKTQDEALIKKRFEEEDVFFSHMPTEFTLDVTHLTPEESATRIIQRVIA